MVTDTVQTKRPSDAVVATITSALGAVVAFVVAIVALHDLGVVAVPKLSGFDAVLGVPSVAGSVILFSVLLVWNVLPIAGARLPHGLHVAAIVVASLTTLYELAAVALGVSWFSIVLLLVAVLVLLLTIRACRRSRNADDVPQLARTDRTRVLAVVLVIAGLCGLLAAYNLTVDKVIAYVDPGAHQTCDFSILVQCSKNLGEWQGSLFGFPNPLIGLGAFAVPLVVGIAILAGARFARWFWVAFNGGVLFAILFVGWLIWQSVFALYTLCPWCSLVWTVTIPMFWLVTLYNLKSGNIRVSARATTFFAAAYTWVPLITLVCYIIVGTLFQVYLDAINRL